jgi:hypothetical protein
MRRMLDDALQALREHLQAWAKHQVRPDVRVLVYPPEWEAAMLAKMPAFAAECAEAGMPLELVDVGQRFRAELERRSQRLAALLRDDAAGQVSVPRDLGMIAASLMTALIQEEPTPPAICRILTNTGTLATFTSYSAMVNRLYDAVAIPVVLLFPGEGDDRALNILGLRADPSYRVPRL